VPVLEWNDLGRIRGQAPNRDGKSRNKAIGACLLITPEHEHELRALIDMEEADPDLHDFFGIETSQYGIYKSIGLKG
jgi:hypothetical protein